MEQKKGKCAGWTAVKILVAAAAVGYVATKVYQKIAAKRAACAEQEEVLEEIDLDLEELAIDEEEAIVAEEEA